MAASLVVMCAAERPRQLRYINPLPIEDAPGLADPTIIRFKGAYYLFASGGMVWVSQDLVHWQHKPVTLPDRRRATAPHAFEYNGQVYLIGNDTGFFRAPQPTGPWEYLGDLKDETGNVFKPFDPMVFVDDDGRVYLYYSGRHTSGIWGVELDRKDLNRFLTKPARLWTFNSAHRWERYGDSNEGAQVSWLEAPWMTKRKGVYYLQYSAPGTEWKTYAVGVYTSKHPLGPFQYAPRNPILVHQNGLINGTGHHSVFEGPDGNLWAVYTVLFRNWSVFDRRIGMDPVGFDKAGNMFVRGPSEIPQLAPGAASKPSIDNDSGSIPVSISRYTWSASSARPGHEPLLAFDNNVRTWWEPDPSDQQPWIMLDLGCRNPDDPNQEFMIDSARIVFDSAPQFDLSNLTIDGHKPWFRSSPVSRASALGPYKYKLESSLDGKAFQVVVDQTANTARQSILFDQFTPVRARYTRLTITAAPKDVPYGLLEFTIFGSSAPERSAGAATN